MYITAWNDHFLNIIIFFEGTTMSRSLYFGAGTAFLFSIMAVFAGGCATRDGEETAGQAAKASAFAEEQAIGDKMIKALRDNDADTFLSFLHKDTRVRFGKKEFESNRADMKKLFGEIVSAQYVTALEMPTLHPMIWKIRFRRAAQQKDAAPVFHENLFQIVFGRLDGKPCVLSFLFL